MDEIMNELVKIFEKKGEIDSIAEELIQKGGVKLWML